MIRFQWNSIHANKLSPEPASPQACREFSQPARPAARICKLPISFLKNHPNLSGIFFKKGFQGNFLVSFLFKVIVLVVSCFGLACLSPIRYSTGHPPIQYLQLKFPGLFLLTQTSPYFFVVLEVFSYHRLWRLTAILCSFSPSCQVGFFSNFIQVSLNLTSE